MMMDILALRTATVKVKFVKNTTVKVKFVKENTAERMRNQNAIGLRNALKE